MCTLCFPDSSLPALLSFSSISASIVYKSDNIDGEYQCQRIHKRHNMLSTFNAA